MDIQGLPKIVNSVGLVCDIAGAVILWKYGLPESISRTGTVHLALEQQDAAVAAKAKRYDMFASIGLSLLILGFVLQLISNFIPQPKKLW